VTKKKKCEPENFITDEEREQGRSWIILFNLFGVFIFDFIFYCLFFLWPPTNYILFMDLIFFFLKFGIRFKNQLIQGDQSHHRLKLLIILFNTFCQKCIYYLGTLF